MSLAYRRRARAVAILLLLSLLLPEGASLAAPRKRRPRRPARVPTVSLVWHVENAEGKVLNTRKGNEPINPASVVKVATTLWALERLGPDFRFDTYFLARGRVDVEAGVLEGDLVVHGAGDLNFQIENAMLVAETLNRMGVRRVTGRLIVDPLFWIGWEGGSAGTQKDPSVRGTVMAGRLRSAFEPRLWKAWERATWRRVATRRGLDPATPPRIVIEGGLDVETTPSAGNLLVAHQSNTLVDVLRKFNCHSTNDIERLDATAGPPEALAPWLAMRAEAPPKSVTLQTSSGLGVNRVAPATLVRILREFRKSAEHMGYPIESLLPVAGCEGCTVTKSYPRLASGRFGSAVAAKTGTLTTTDGGTAVLAGFVSTANGDLTFCVAAPRAGRYLGAARHAIEEWLVQLIATNGGARSRSCAPPSADLADVRVVAMSLQAATTSAAPAPAPAGSQAAP